MNPNWKEKLLPFSEAILGKSKHGPYLKYARLMKYATRIDEMKTFSDRVQAVHGMLAGSGGSEGDFELNIDMKTASAALAESGYRYEPQPNSSARATMSLMLEGVRDSAAAAGFAARDFTSTLRYLH